MYELVLDPIAEEQIAALPDEALRPLAELFTLLETAPWSGEPYNSANPKANMLTHAFGERGLATLRLPKTTSVQFKRRVSIRGGRRAGRAGSAIGMGTTRSGATWSRA